MASQNPRNKPLLEHAEYYIIKIVLILTTAIVGLAFLIWVWVDS